MQFRRLKLLFLSSGAALVLFLVLLVLIWGRTPPGPPLPNPNGYDDFVAAGKKVNGDPSSFPALNQEQLRGVVRSNSEPLRLVHLGMTRACRAPTALLMTNIGILTTDLPALKRVALLLAAEGRLDEMQNRPADAALSYLRAIELGDRLSHGGLLINRLVGIACEAIGMNPLLKLFPALNCQQSHPIVAELERIDRNGVTWDEVMQAEHRFAHSQLRKPSNLIPAVLGWWGNRLAIKHAEQKHYRASAQLRLLTVDLALRCYLSENGRLPLNLEMLVPGYLAKVPLDPFNQQPLIFRPHGTNWLVYSAGPDGVDDGGKSIAKVTGAPVPKGDVLLDSPW